MRLFFLATMVIVTSCKQASFSSGTTNTSPGKMSGSDQAPPPADDPACMERILPVRVVFALDVTTSMVSDLDTVVQNVAGFARRMEDLKFRGATGKVPVQIGLIEFTDRLFRQVDLSDAQSFVSKISGLEVQDDGNQDNPEAGLLAVEAAAKMLEQAHSNEGEGLPIIVVVTDALAHDGGGGSHTRNCDITTLEPIAVRKTLKRLAVYDSSPEETLGGADDANGSRMPLPPEWAFCEPYTGGVGSGPQMQWRDMRSRIMKSRPGSGAALGYPFSASSLMTAIPRDLENTWKVCK